MKKFSASSFAPLNLWRNTNFSTATQVALGQADEYACHVRRYNSRDLHRKIRRQVSSVKEHLIRNFFAAAHARITLAEQKIREFDPPRSLIFLVG